jgi:hypothetical protein
MATSRPVLIHVGTHKTGTTSLQMLFTRHRAELRDQGILYPETGVWSGGSETESHSNIAWELMGHVLFDSTSGTLDDLIDEIAASDCEKVLLSSEEFSCLFNRPERLRDLKDRLEAAGLAPRIALTFRDVDEYAASLYVTLASFAFDMDYVEFTERVATEGQVTFRQNTYCFDYDLLERTFRDVFGEEAVTCIAYDSRDAVGQFLTSFDWFFGGALDGTDVDVRSNSSMSRVEELRNRVRVRQQRIDALEDEIDGLESQIRGLNVTLDWFRTALAASENRFSRRVVRKIRSLTSRHPPN